MYIGYLYVTTRVQLQVSNSTFYFNLLPQQLHVVVTESVQENQRRLRGWAKWAAKARYSPSCLTHIGVAFCPSRPTAAVVFVALIILSVTNNTEEGTQKVLYRSLWRTKDTF